MDNLRKVVRDRQELESMGRLIVKQQNPNRIEENSGVEEIRNSIGSLPPADRALLILYYENDLPIREIAVITGNTESATKSKLYHIRQKLKQSLSKSEGLNHAR
jgi:RNA polymerase sigma factor (sigma-70 family)